VTEPLRLSFTVACPPEHAFATWANRASLWWPAGHTVTGEQGLEILWHLRADRTDATEVEVAFTGQDDGSTRVDIEHRGWDRLGERAPAWRERNQRGWSGVIPTYVAACTG